VFRHGLPAEAIIGILRRPLGPGQTITPEVFARNRVFVEFMHAVIENRAPSQPGLIAEARRQGNGWVYIVDQRTRTPNGAVPPEDIVGAFEVKDGRVLADSYRPNPKHMILSPDGFFRLGEELQACLLQELAIIAARGVGPQNNGM
jgi:hypothetical protein